MSSIKELLRHFRRKDVKKENRQGARLIAAENIHAAEILNGRQSLGDHLIERHSFRAVREIDTAHGRKQELKLDRDYYYAGRQQ